MAWLPVAAMILLWAAALWLDRAERLDWRMATLLYVPTAPALAVWAPVFLVSVLIGRSWPAALAGLLLSALWYFQDFRFGPGLVPARPEQSRELRILTWNCGENEAPSIGEVVGVYRPDVVVVQDYWRGKLDYPHEKRAGEFACFSRFPIVSGDLLPLPEDARHRGRKNMAGRFVLEDARRRFAVYAVHMPTPRNQLNGGMDRLTGGRVRWMGGEGGGQWTGDENAHWDWRIKAGQALAHRVAEEKFPVIVAGDFNAPPFGAMERPFSGLLRDAHVAAGQGHGDTFPGDQQGWWALVAPWLRLDRILVSDEWEVLGCGTADSERWEHRPVIADVVRKD
ncbi:MAG TPA: endonuclease/exonuclease/phosphatase family protein [Verrucomicrobiales bacterium]|nr:endonuclease/exonuclease/phosphatase family protein [Verrucomicrobiales bacterium]